MEGLVMADHESFSFERDEEPIIRLGSYRNRPRRPDYGTPIWGTFLILLTVFLAGAGWLGYRYWDNQRRAELHKKLQQMEDEYQLERQEIKAKGTIERAKAAAEVGDFEQLKRISEESDRESERSERFWDEQRRRDLDRLNPRNGNH
jgi:hypothetical protein